MKKVVVVEDDENVRNIVAEIVQSLGHMAIQASDGRIALQVIYDNPDVDLLITDLMMPEMKGTDLIKILRGNEKFAHLPAILISGVVDEEEAQKVMVLGTSHYMHKPVRFKELSDLIQSMFIDEDGTSE